MDTLFLQTYLEVVDQQSITKAARRLEVSPAAVTQRIRALEAELGVKLLVRTGRGVVPTDSGRSFIAGARRTLRFVNRLKVIATGGLPAGELRLGAISSAASILPELLGAMFTEHPQIPVYVTQGSTIETYERVARGELDAAIISEPPAIDRERAAWHLLREEPLVVLSHISSRRDHPHRLLETEPFIRYDRESLGGDLADSYLNYVGLKLREICELRALHTIAVLVGRGFGISLVPDWDSPWLAQLSIRKTPVPSTDFVRRIGLVWTREPSRRRIVSTFLEAVRLPLRDAFDDLPTGT